MAPGAWRVIVTRPAAQAGEWVALLRAQAIDAVALPLIEIAAVADPAPLSAAWRALATNRLVVFVSPNAVAQFVAARPPSQRWPAAVLAGSPGPGTSRALRDVGVPAAQIVEPPVDSPQFDSQALWSVLQQRDDPWAGARVLVVRGDGGRDALAQALRAAGAQVDHLTAYRRVAPRFDAAQKALLRSAQAAPEDHCWLFSSSEAIDHLLAAAPAGDWARAAAVATHPRIAERARQAAFGRVDEARPAPDAVVACIQSMRT